MPSKPTRRPNGRPTKFTPDVGLFLAELIAAGVSHAAAAKRAGLDPATVKRWLRRGRSDLRSGRLSDHAALAGLLIESRAGTSARSAPRPVLVPSRPPPSGLVTDARACSR